VAEPISDKQVVAVLRPFVAATAPVLDALREADPLGLRAKMAAAEERGESLAELEQVEPTLRRRLIDGLAAVRVPGSAGWQRMDAEERTAWWIHRVGRITALITAVPGLGGALADRFPVQDAVGAAAQGLLLCAIAGEHGVTDKADRVRLLAWVLFDRDVDRALAAGEQPEERRRIDELTEDLPGKPGGKMSLKALAVTLWRLGRTLLAISDELEKRPQGRLIYRMFGVFPVIGAPADYLSERSALKKAAKRARRWMQQHAGTQA
jgi:hypothetical protein